MEGNTGEAEEWFRKAVGVEPQKARRNLQRLQRIAVTDGRRLQDGEQVIRDKRLSVEDKSRSVQDDGGER